ncbi:arginase family protein [Haloglomus salinum]|jgi:agmatinase|uniref:arginase family protein n=1 Tax=Haloglomus salinum TaxID=2962673 RepID=UPI0020C94712|nr:arginase family protein [Haloglomus salinum]
MIQFPGATASRSDGDYVLVGAPLDRSTSFQPGTRFGPAQVRRYARGFENYDHRTDQLFTDCAVHDADDVEPWADADEYLDFLTDQLGDIRADGGAVPLLVGGEHTVSIAGVRAVDPDVFVCLDAHLDLREELGGDPLSHSTVTRHALEVADEAVVLGARAGSEAEWERASEADVEAVPPEAVPDWVADFDDESVYLSVDVDAADPSVAPGTGTPEPFGLSSREMRDVVRTVAPHADGFDCVEVNDRDDGQAAVLGAKLLREFVFAHAAEM